MNGASGVSWIETLPAATEPVGSVLTRFHSLKTAIRTGMDDEHNFPAASGSGFGYHRYGSTRAYVGTQSQVSSDGSDARLMVASDSSLLFGMSAVAPFFLGGFGVISMISSAGSGFPQRHQWVMDSGTIFNAGATDISVATFQGSGYSGIPAVMFTSYAGGSIDTSFTVVRSISTRHVAFSSVTSATGATSETTTHWFSVGSRAI